MQRTTLLAVRSSYDQTILLFQSIHSRATRKQNKIVSFHWADRTIQSHLDQSRCRWAHRSRSSAIAISAALPFRISHVDNSIKSIKIHPFLNFSECHAQKRKHALSLGSIFCENVACGEAGLDNLLRIVLASGWPRVTNIPGDINFDDPRKMVVDFETPENNLVIPVTDSFDRWTRA